MNGTLFAVAITLMLTLGGCAESPVSTKPAQGDVVAASGGAPAKQICHRERPTGSEIPVTVCRTAESEAEDARSADAAQRQIAHDSAVAGEEHAFSGH